MMETASWLVFGLLSVALFVGVLIQVEERLEHRRRVRRTLRIIDRFGNKPW